MATRSQTQPLVFIRFALLAGVLLFGTVAWFLHRRGLFPVSSQSAAVRYAQLASCVLALVSVFAMRGRAARAADGVERNSELVRLWAIGEFPALFGGVLFLLTNEAQWYALGLVVMLTTFWLTPIRRWSFRS